MKTNLLLIAVMLITTAAFAQNDKPLRKIATGTGQQELNEEVQREVQKAMQDLRIDLKDLDIRVNTEVAESLEGLDLELNEEINEGIESSLHGLEGLDEIISTSVNQSLKILDHLDINIDLGSGHNENWADEFRKEALKDDSKNDSGKSPRKKE